MTDSSAMEVIRRAFLIAAILILALSASVMALGELSGEVVVLQTRDQSGEWRNTRLWVVEHEGALWLRAGGRATSSPDSWFARLVLDPDVRLERGGVVEDFIAVPVPEAQDVINDEMRRDYPLADQMIRGIRGVLISDESDTSKPIRLDPADAGSLE